MEDTCKVCGGRHKTGECTEKSSKKEGNKKRELFKDAICKKIEEKLAKINFGSYDAAENYGGGDSVDLYDEADNIEEVLDEAEETIDLAYKEDWSTDKLIAELNKIIVKIDTEPQEKHLSFVSYGMEEKPLSYYVDISEEVESHYGKRG
ncbi:MAG: hypothetical protein WCV83_02450 [Candidatus Magasanikbacteria bacterium]|jgi:hypothetical protein